MLLGQFVEFGGVEEAGAGCLDWRRWIDDNHIILIPGAAEVATAIIDDNMAFRIFAELLCVSVIESERFRDTRHQFYGCDIDVPAQRGAVSGAHAEADKQGGLR